MLPIVNWYLAGSKTPATLGLAPTPASGGRPLRRLLGHGLMRLGRALSRPARAPRSPLVGGVLPR